MNRNALFIALASIVLTMSATTFADERNVQSSKEAVTNPGQAMPAFPPSDECTANQPCRNVVGEVIRIEESYWIKLPNGNELHMKTTKDSKLDKLPKVGDKIAAQLSSSGDVEAMKVLGKLPEQKKLKTPKKSLEDVR